ncbi:carbonic anhydrase 1-like [Saccoglossus kowalevskii]|uniref:Carbonic anhydrase n=1 Tax=Saccoglossus kowalevskii TaxID=10224 RepID=A0ABM0GRP1_SACKO|nr:PREDICTED: carbonic anhydrase 3-like [Saccoglossus kowalevskii]
MTRIWILLLSLCMNSCHSQEWSYSGETGPANWHKMYPTCGGENQSPISILTTEAEEMAMLNFTWTGFGDDPPNGASMTLSNLGTTVQVNFTGDYLISGGGLTNTYKATMLHFHWDENGVHGSEHTLDEVRYPIEMHLVGYDFEKYDDFDSALSHPEGIIVVATFLEITSEDNPNYSEMFTGFNSVTYKGQSYQYPSPFPILPMLPYNTWDFYRYHGSLTTPACDEGVLWTVFVQYQQISHDQFSNFNTLMSNFEGEENVPLSNNYRPVQPLNGRSVYRRIDGELAFSKSTEFRINTWMTCVAVVLYYWTTSL